MNIFFKRVIRWVAVVAVLPGLLTVYSDRAVQAQNFTESRPNPRPVRLCPRQEARTTAYRDAQVVSSDESVVQATYVRSNEREGGDIIIRAQENDTDSVRRATLSIRKRDMFIMFDEEEVISIQVLPRRQCETPQGLGTARLTGTVLDPNAEVRHDYRYLLELCEGRTWTSRDLEFNGDNLTIIAATSDNPAVATAVVESGSPGKYRMIVNALQEGDTMIRFTAPFTPEGWGNRLLGRITLLHVIVKPCEPKQEPSGDKQTGFIPGVAPGFKETEQYGLKNQAYTFPQGQILLTFPSDVKPGEQISGAILAQPYGQTPEEKAANAQQLAQYPIQIQSVKTFADEPAKNFDLVIPGNDVEEGENGQGHITSTVTITDPKNEQPLITTNWMSALATDILINRQPKTGENAETFSCPDQRQAGQPFEIKGPFDGRHDSTHVKLGETPVIILGETPRGLIVIPQQEMPGEPQVLVLDENNKHFEKSVLSYASQPATQPAVTSPEGSQTGVTPDPIQQMCDMIVDVYKQNTQSMVDEGWQAPKPPHKGVWVAVLEYEITPQRTVQNLRVVKSSGYQPIDESARARVYSLQGTFRQPPSCVTKPIPITHTFKVIYH